MEMEVFFPGGKKVNSTYNGFTVKTDQPKNEGGDGTAPEPYDLFLASIGTCAGVYVVYFCQERGIDTSQIKMTLQFDRNETKHLVEAVRMGYGSITDSFSFPKFTGIDPAVRIYHGSLSVLLPP